MTVYLLWRRAAACDCCFDLFGIYSTKEKRAEVVANTNPGAYDYWDCQDWELDD